MNDPAAEAGAIQYRTIPSAVFVKPYAVEHFNYLCGLLTDGHIDEDGLLERILDDVKYRRGMTTSWESLEVEVTGRTATYLVEIRVNGDTWYVSPDQIMRVALRAKR